MATNLAVSLTFSPPTSVSALLTDSLNTWWYVLMHTFVVRDVIIITYAVRSTLILEKDVSWMCSYLSLGRIERPDDLPESPSYRLLDAAK